MGGRPLSSSPVLQGFIEARDTFLAQVAAGQFNGKDAAQVLFLAGLIPQPTAAAMATFLKGAVGATPILTGGVVSALPAGSTPTFGLVPTGTVGTYRVDVGLPIGGQGNTGPAPTITASASTLAAGSSATAGVTGGNGTFNIAIGVPSGPTGPAPTLQTGNTTTLSPGQPATFTVVSLGNGAYRLDAAIPQGAPGAGSGDMLKANNLSELPDKDQSLANLGAGIGTGGGRAIFKAADASAIRTLLALGSAAQLTAGTSAGNVLLLPGDAKVPTTNLPEAILGAMKYQSAWDASTNTPALATPPAASTKGFYYIVSVAGSTDLAGGVGTNEWKVGDWAVSNGTRWDKVDSSDQVNSVAGLMGTITAAALLNALGASVNALGQLTPAADRLPYFTSATAAALAPFTAYGRAIIALADAAALTAQINVVSTAAKGAVPQLPGNTTTFLRGDGTFAAPAAATSLIRTSVPFAGGEFNIAWLPPSSGGTFNITLYSDNSTAIQLSTAHINRDLQSGYVAVANSVTYGTTTSITVPAGKTLYLSRTTQNAGGYIIIEQTA